MMVPTPSFYDLFVKREYQQLPSFAEHSEMKLQNVLGEIATYELIRTVTRIVKLCIVWHRKPHVLEYLHAIQYLQMDEVRWLPHFFLLERRVVLSL